MAHLLIVDDDDAFRDTLAETLEGLGHGVTAVAGGAEALDALARTRFDAVFLDHRMPGMDGLQTLSALRARAGRLPPVIVLTAFSSAGNTIEAMRLGAFDHLAKPIGREAVREVLERALQQRTATAPSAAPDDADDAELIGPSEAMREVHKRIGLAAASAMPVLVLGETGTGKEMVARALHRHSARAGGPFVAINCSAIPKELLESELFGHVRGAFTGATGERPGCFRAADGGVLLLDEIGDMALDVQAKMLRALQEGEVTPLGGHRTVKVDVRVVAATHRDLRAAVREGRFREDLLYRLDVLSIRLPPLRERLADIIPLAEHFLRRAVPRDATEPPKSLSAEAARRLLGHPWPGNVRELRNAMERCQALVRHRVIGEADLAAALGAAPAVDAAPALPADWLEAELPVAVERLERLLIAHALAQAQGNRAEAARRLGIHRQLLYRKLTQYGLE
ncbi:AAA family ATPase [Variovorax paradoxus]|jgi:two-component system NtrC family response regulator|uniref:sigma-54-dependent transcriptional regulator n=1 Tax=Variovorax paradoxus TaxID=34073 RepID=UPI0006E4AC20|nr:AAA family ATPase [Variovorax paradoxus]KPV00785.1 AAA family ATPase [Variovorax paradoxus]KPV05295.1 AAA family ATPase [Variovorax paradoxus]KPV16823.1 AAA family ATPase [Variovorax paradoxus]KPV29278.1 AAA family ATPase [Variovorax paradoxus]